MALRRLIHKVCEESCVPPPVGGHADCSNTVPPTALLKLYLASVSVLSSVVRASFVQMYVFEQGYIHVSELIDGLRAIRGG